VWGALAEPGVARCLPGLVVDQRVAAFLQAVHAVDAAGELEPGHAEGAPLLERRDLERGARLLDLEPFGRALLASRPIPPPASPGARAPARRSGPRGRSPSPQPQRRSRLQARGHGAK